MHPISYFETLPKGKLSLILEKVPCYEQKFVISSVCRKWYLLTKQMFPFNFDELVKRCLSSPHELRSELDYRITQASDYLNKNGLTFIYQIKKLNLKTTFYECDNGGDGLGQNFLNVNWNPKMRNYQITENGGGNWGDLQINLSLKLNRFIATDNTRKPIYRKITIKSTCGQHCQEAGMISWRDCNKSDEIKREIKLVEDLLLINVHTCVQRALNINMQFLRNKPCPFEGDTKEVAFSCNKIGVIIDSKNSDSKHVFKLILKESERYETLLWETEDYVEDVFRDTVSTEQFLRWSVISKTTDYLIGIWNKVLYNSSKW